MKDARFMALDSINEKLAKKIVAFFKAYKRISDNDSVYATFGSKQQISIDNSVVATQNRLEYYVFTAKFGKEDFTAINYSDIAEVMARHESGYDYIYIALKNAEQIKINIAALPEDSKKFYDFLVRCKDRRIIDSTVFSKNPDTIIKCPSCGANNAIEAGSTGKCEYCGSFLQG